MRRLALITATVALLACNKDTPTTTPPPADATPATPTAAADDDGAPSADAEAKAEKDAAEKKQQEQIDAMLQRANKRADEVRAHWTDELIASFKKMRDKKYGKPKARLKAVLASAHRMPGDADRDKYRHPDKTLEFFGMKPNMKVFEVGPGAGWYTEILAPYLAQGGALYIAGAPEKQDNPVAQAQAKVSELWLSAPGPLYENVEALAQPERGQQANLGPEGSLDMVLVVRMLHNIERGKSWDSLMPSIHSALKDGAVLGVVQHRAAEGADPTESAGKGYLPEKWLVEKIESYGFKLDKSSEINANPKDTKDYEQGVWTLPPVLALGDTDKDKYLEIGESDRMTLRFKKVAAKK